MKLGINSVDLNAIINAITYIDNYVLGINNIIKISLNNNN